MRWSRAAIIVSELTVKVMAEIITSKISWSCWQRGQFDGVVCPQSVLSESGEGEGHRPSIVGFKWEHFCQR